MYCSNCGKKIDDGNIFCTGCGVRLNKENENTSLNKIEDNGLRIASIVLGTLGIVGSLTLIFSMIGFILSLVGLILGIVATKKGKNVLGIVLNSLGLFLSLIVILIIVLIFGLANNHDNEYDFDDYYHGSYYEKFKDVMTDY